LLKKYESKLEEPQIFDFRSNESWNSLSCRMVIAKVSEPIEKFWKKFKSFRRNTNLKG